MSTPFRDRVLELHKSMRYTDMAQACDKVRQESWWNEVANGKDVGPPYRDRDIDGIAKLFQTTADQVRAMVAEQWLGVAPAHLSDRVKRLAPQIDSLDGDDAELVEAFTDRLALDYAPREPKRKIRIVRRSDT
ncbi:hypothetical protein ACIP2X_17025 [Streptomyces sp. NPDC089424]|uniref:hypothetical protein n=1 Tax=Streptomyces sp. NPDC089424 TaxID=3365917 RepID=UPI003816DFC8